MSITDQDQLSEIQLRILEPDNQGASFPSGLWTVAEILDYFNQRQNRFNRDTRLMLAQASVPSVAAQTRYTDGMPPDWITTQRVTYVDSTLHFHPMEINDAFTIDMGISANRLPSFPIIFDETTPPLMSFDVAPTAPDNLGRFDILYASLLEVLDGTGQIFDIPDDFVPYVTYGVLCDMFAKVGRAQNPELADYYEGRYQEGVALAAVMLAGRY